MVGNINLVELLVFWTAVFGIAYTMSNLHGPFGLCEKLRTWVKSKSTEPWITTGIGCPICLSFWVSFFISPLVATNFRDDLLLIASSVGFAAVVILLSPPADDGPDGF